MQGMKEYENFCSDSAHYLYAPPNNTLQGYNRDNIAPHIVINPSASKQVYDKAMKVLFPKGQIEVHTVGGV